MREEIRRRSDKRDEGDEVLWRGSWESGEEGRRVEMNEDGKRSENTREGI